MIVERRDGTTVTGKLIASEGTHAVVMQPDNAAVTIPKDDAVALTEEQAPAPTPPETQTDPPPDDKPDWPYKKLGVFTSHGVGYSHWRARGGTFREGGASYALDLGVGYNFSERFGVYGLFGGAVGARLLDGNMRGHYGHFAISLLVRRKYFAFLPGIGVALSGRKGPGDNNLRETGIALPIKLMGVIPLPKDLFLGIGLGYDLAIMADTRLFQTISGQITVGRW